MKLKGLLVCVFLILGSVQILFGSPDSNDLVRVESVSDSWSILSFLIFLGSLGLFLYGMKVMSEGVQKAAGQRMRVILNSMTANPFRGISTGFITTSIIQSSSATTVMVVSFVNAGLLNLRQAFGVIMGANIGTTITSWLIVIFGFGNFSVSSFSLPLIAIAVPFLFSSKSFRKSAGEFIIGFALLFLGLEFLRSSVPDLTKQPYILELIHSWSGDGIQFVLIGVFIGTVVTMIIQSSSAAMAVTLVLCNQGYISFEMAAAMVLGQNIGTTITANLAALVANNEAKRAARTHFLFNLIGVIWMLFIFSWFLKGIEFVMIQSTDWDDPFADPKGRIIALSALHSSFNIINMLLLVWFTDPIIKLSSRLVRHKNEADEFHLEYIQTGVMTTPELGILEAQKEVAKYGNIASRMSDFTRKLLSESDPKEKQMLLQKIEKYETITDRIEIEIGNYLSKISEEDLSDLSSRHVRAMLSINNDLERIGDIFFQMSKSVERKDTDRIWFTPDQRNNLISMFDLIDEAFAVMNENLEKEFLKADLAKAIDCENKINQRRNELRSQHLENVEKQEYNVKSGMIYSDLFSSMEKIGDHIINVSEAAAGKM
ncbi:MAG: Na/Pi cotransporter family protein [Crocinitomicaceae bacterium]|nr:Na/Pi cotransporter family protein [Crocinitomicaceae bacterium]